MILNDTIIQIETKSPNEICSLIAEKVKKRRLELNLTQEGLSSRADINLSTFRKFERTGEISLKSLVKIAFVLNSEDDLIQLFSQIQYNSIDDVLQGNKIRKRGKKLWNLSIL